MGLFLDESTNSIILGVLTEGEKKAKEIFLEVKKRKPYDISYQAIHKSLKKLVGGNILILKERKYSINKKWIEKLTNFIEGYNYNLHSNNKYREIKMLKEQGEVKIFFVETLAEVFEVMKKVRRNFIAKFKDVPLNKRPIRITHLQHLYSILLNPLDSYAGFKKNEIRFKHYYLIKGDTKIDRESLNIKLSFNDTKRFDKHLLGVSLPRGTTLFIYDDLIIEQHLDKSFNDKMNSFFKNQKDIKDFKREFFIKKFFSKKTKIKFVVYKDKDLAKLITEDTIKYFKNHQIYK